MDSENLKARPKDSANPMVANQPSGYGRIVKRSSSSATSIVGVILMIVGFCLLFMPLLGTIIGIALICLGFALQNKFVCSVCRNKVDDKEVRICPTCKAPLR